MSKLIARSILRREGCLEPGHTAPIPALGHERKRRNNAPRPARHASSALACRGFARPNAPEGESRMRRLTQPYPSRRGGRIVGETAPGPHPLPLFRRPTGRLGEPWRHPRSILGSAWVCSGFTLGPFWGQSASILVQESPKKSQNASEIGKVSRGDGIAVRPSPCDVPSPPCQPVRARVNYRT